jgi:hypothetical protein
VYKGIYVGIDNVGNASDEFNGFNIGRSYQAKLAFAAGANSGMTPNGTKLQGCASWEATEDYNPSGSTQAARHPLWTALANALHGLPVASTFPARGTRTGSATVLLGGNRD